MAKAYSISSIEEAWAYLNHEILNERLRECTQLVLSHPDSSLSDIFGQPDDLKFQSCMTLFLIASGGDKLFKQALDTFCEGRLCAFTEKKLICDSEKE